MELDQELCRICLRNAIMPGLKNVNIFTTMACEDLVANLLIDCADVEVFQGDGCPEIVCSPCLISLEQAYSFKNLIQRSDRVLKARLEECDTFQIEMLDEAEVPEQPADESNLGEVLADVKTEGEQDWVEEEIVEEIEIIKEVLHSPTKNEILETEEEELEVLVEEENDVEEPKYVVHESEKYFSNCICCMCGYEFSSQRDLKEHVADIHGVDLNASPVVSSNAKFPCLTCRVESFSNRTLLRRHQLANIKQLCTVCGGAYSVAKLKQHMRMHKQKSDPTARQPCPICKKQIAGNQMWVHKKTHMEVAQFECDVCGKAFKLKNYLKNHVVRHFPALMQSKARDKKHECDDCNKMFENAYKLKEHYAVHTGEKRYQCEYCDSKFKNTTDRRRHQWLVHTGSPYSCHKCHKQFDRPSLLKNHETNCQCLLVQVLQV